MKGVPIGWLGMGLALALAPAGLHAQGFPARDQGTFIIAKQGQQLGTERFTLRSDRQGLQLDARLDYAAGDKSQQQEAALRLRSGAALDTYRRTAGPDTITLRYAQERLTARYQTHAGAGHAAFAVPATIAVLDENVFSLWEVLADRYDAARGGAQTFGVFEVQPGEEQPSQVTLTAVHVAGAPRDALRLVVQTDQATLRLDLRGGRLMRLEAPDAGLTVSRQGK